MTRLYRNWLLVGMFTLGASTAVLVMVAQGVGQ